MNITVKMLESIGVGIIRAEHIKSTIKGRIYKATAYYDNKSIDLSILYYRHGGSKILGPITTGNGENEIKEFTAFITYIAPRLPRPNYKVRRTLFIGLLITIPITAINITHTYTQIDVIINTVDIIATLTLLILYRRERGIYER